MCGVIGFYSQHVTADDLRVLKKVLIASQIRGKHASGFAWFDGSKLQSCTYSLPMSDALNDFSLKDCVYNHSISLIAHTRYSTSDLNFNQPILIKNTAIVHNGVISQSSPEKWRALYGYSCKTKNDSELLLQCIINGDNPKEMFPEASIAALVLHSDGSIMPMRNSKRPLWRGRIGRGRVYASTWHILSESGVTHIQKMRTEEDLQRRDMRAWDDLV